MEGVSEEYYGNLGPRRMETLFARPFDLSAIIRVHRRFLTSSISAANRSPAVFAFKAFIRARANALIEQI